MKIKKISVLSCGTVAKEVRKGVHNLRPRVHVIVVDWLSIVLFMLEDLSGLDEEVLAGSVPNGHPCARTDVVLSLLSHQTG